MKKIIVTKDGARKLVFQALAVYLNGTTAEKTFGEAPGLYQTDIPNLRNEMFDIEQSLWDKSEDAPEIWGK